MIFIIILLLIIIAVASITGGSEWPFIKNNRFVDYPYVKFTHTPKQLEKIFRQVVNYKSNFNHPPIKCSLDWSTRTFNTSFFKIKKKELIPILLIPSSDHYKYHPLVDYFQEQCRLKCRRNNQEISFIDFYKKNLGKINNYLIRDKRKLKPDDIWEYFSKFPYGICSEFDPVWQVAIIDFFRQFIEIDTVLDMSAGRGARMIGSIARGVNYLGVDPNECTNKNYDKMKNFYMQFVKPVNCEIINSGFEEDFKLPSWFTTCDLMFSSPPYFDLELFVDESGKMGQSQSVTKYPGMEQWLEHFMKRSMLKIIKLLRPGGIMAINIDNPRHQKMDYVTPLLNFEEVNSQTNYLGVVTIMHETGVYYSTWCWQKK